MPDEIRARLLSQGHRIPIQKDDVLCEAGRDLAWTYLPCSGLVSVQTMTATGDSVEIAMAGREGMIGLMPGTRSQPVPYSAIVSVGGDAFRIHSGPLLAEFDRSAPLRRALLNYWGDFLRDVAQGSVCHRFHTARQRLARWVLSASDRTGHSKIEMTQEALAQRLGLQRARVTQANLELQDVGAIRSRHGRITIADRRRLEQIACECYPLTRAARVSSTMESFLSER